MQRVKEKAIQLLHDQIVDRVIGWRAGEFFYDLTPSVFTSVEDIEKNFVWSVFSGANLSKYLIAESRKGGKAAVFLKPCDSYSFVQLLKEHRILRETVYAVGVQCDGMCDMEAIKELGLAGVTAVTEDGEDLRVSTMSGRSRRPMRCCSSARPARAKNSSASTSCSVRRARKIRTAAVLPRLKNSSP